MPTLRFEILREKLFVAALQFAMVVSALSTVSIFAFLLYFAIPLFTLANFAELFTVNWDPFENKFGILPMIVGSLLLALLSLLMAYPLALGICCFAHGIGPKVLSKLVMVMVQFMTSIPTVVYGFVSVFLLVPLLRHSFPYGTGYSLLAASLVLSILILPTIVLVIHSQLQIIEPQVRLVVASLGIEPSQKLLSVLLPSASRGLFTAAVLGFGRAIGDTIIALMVAGNAPQFPDSLHDSIRALTSHIALVVATDSTSPAYMSLFACGLLLFGSALLVNLALRLIKRGAKAHRST